MKNKRLIYLLLPVVLLIWGLIFYRVWASTAQPEAHTRIRATSAAALAPPTPTARPALALNYPDPFRTAAAAPTPPPQPAATWSTSDPHPAPATFRALPPPPPPVPAAQPVVWPQLEYIGLIENQQQHTRVAMVKINSEQLLLQPARTHQGVTLRAVYPDSIRVQYQRITRTVLRQR